MTSNGTICHGVLLTDIHVVIFSFKGCCCVLLCAYDIGDGGVGLGREKKSVSVRITLSLFLSDPLSNPEALHVFVTVFWQSDWIL